MTDIEKITQELYAFYESIKMAGDDFEEGDVVNGYATRIASIITAQADWVSDEEIEAEAKLCFPYSTTDTHGDAIVVLQRGAFWTCAKWLRSKLAAPKPDGWVSVDERLPDEFVSVTAWRSDHGYSQAHVDEDGRWYHGMIQLHTVTHWQPLPAPPKTTQ